MLLKEGRSLIKFFMEVLVIYLISREHNLGTFLPRLLILLNLQSSVSLLKFFVFSNVEKNRQRSFGQLTLKYYDDF